MSVEGQMLKWLGLRFFIDKPDVIEMPPGELMRWAKPIAEVFTSKVSSVSSVTNCYRLMFPNESMYNIKKDWSKYYRNLWNAIIHLLHEEKTSWRNLTCFTRCNKMLWSTASKQHWGPAQPVRKPRHWLTQRVIIFMLQILTWKF